MKISTTGQFAATQGRRLLDDVTAEITRSLQSPGIDEVHDLRVAIRRFRRVLAVLESCFPGEETRRIRRGLKKVLDAAGAVRDHDVAMKLIEKVTSSAPELGGSEEILRKLGGKRGKAAAALTASLEKWQEKGLAANWRKALKSASPCVSPVNATAREILPAMAKAHFDCVEDAAHADASMDEIHRFRIEARNLRYTLDLFAPVYGDSLAALLGQLKEMQDLLGDIHDCAVIREIVRGEKAPNRKELLAELKQRQDKKTEHFRERYGTAYAGAAMLEQWETTLRGTGVAAATTKRSSIRRKASR